MPPVVKNVAIIGANKAGLSLLPFILKDAGSRLCMVADANREAMLFKLQEFGYRIGSRFNVPLTNNLEDLKRIPDIHIIIDAVQDAATERFLDQPEFMEMEKLGPLSARLIWGSRAAAAGSPDGTGVLDGQSALLSSLREVVEAVRLSVDRNELLYVILRIAMESTHADRGSIMLISQEERALRIEVAKGIEDELIAKIKVPLGEGIAGRVAQDGKPLLISGKASGGEFERLRDRADVKSALCVPLVVEGKVIGVLNVNNNESALAFTQEDLRFLSSLSALAAEVIHRSNEYEKVSADSAKLKLWKEVDAAMSSFMPLERRLNIVCRRLSEVVAGFTCFIYLFDEDRQRLALKASSIRGMASAGPLNLAPGEGIEGSCINDPKDVILVDRMAENGLRRMYLSLPMVAEEQLIGILNGQVTSPKGLSAQHESFLKEMRGLIAEKVYRHQKHEREELRSRKMFAVDETGLEMITMKDPQRVLHIMATAPAAIVGAEGSVLRLRNERTGGLKVRATYGLDDAALRERLSLVEKDTAQEVMRSRAAVHRKFSEDAEPHVRAVLSQPLFVAEKLAGVITLFNKIDDSIIPPRPFSKADSAILARFAVYAEKALASIFRREVEEALGVGASLSPAELFERRVKGELNRAGRSGGKLVVVTLQIAGLGAVPLLDRERFEARLVETLRKRTRSFDLSAWLDNETIGVLFLDTDERITRILRAIPEAGSSEEAFLNEIRKGGLEIRYGYACYPGHGDTYTALLSRASQRDKVYYSGI